jgi:hypothetical protein
MISGLTSLVCTVAQISTFNASVVIMNIYEHIKIFVWNHVEQSFKGYNG